MTTADTSLVSPTSAVTAPDTQIVPGALVEPRLCVVIVNYRTPQLTLDCLDSLEAEVAALPGTTVVVVEGGSGDDSAERIEAGIAERGFGGWVTLNARDENAGFAGGNNAGLKPALANEPPVPYLLLLNPDTVVRPGGITALVDFMDAHPQAGLAGSRLEDPDGTPQRSAFRFPSARSNFETGIKLGVVSRMLSNSVVAPPVRDDAHRCDWVAGASLIVRREVFEKVGLLKDDYFMYFEEVDFCLAAHRAGFECWYVPDSRVVHLVGQASGLNSKNDTAKPAKRRPAYWFESRRRYFVTNHGRLKAALADAAFITGFGLWRLRRCLTRRPDTDPERLLGDAIRQSVFRRGFRI